MYPRLSVGDITLEICGAFWGPRDENYFRVKAFKGSQAEKNHLSPQVNVHDGPKWIHSLIVSTFHS